MHVYVVIVLTGGTREHVSVHSTLEKAINTVTYWADHITEDNQIIIEEHKVDGEFVRSCIY